MKRNQLSKIKLDLLSDYIDEFIEEYNVKETSDDLFDDIFYSNPVDSSANAKDFIYKRVTEKLIQKENKKKLKENIRDKFKKRKKEKTENIKLRDVSFVVIINMEHKYNPRGLNYRYNFQNVEFHSLNKNPNGESVICFIANNRNKPFGLNYQKGQLVFSIDNQYLTAIKNKNDFDWDDIFNTNHKLIFTYQGQIKILSSVSGILYEFIGKPQNKCLIEYMKEMEEEIKLKIKEQEEKERLAKRLIKRRFTF